MIREKQVAADHYDFGTYMSKQRWISLWYQVDELLKLNPKSVLEIGPGLGLLKKIGGVYGLKIETLDIDPDLRPDHVNSVTDMPFHNQQFDVVCAFQMLEHLPYEISLKAFEEMSRVANRAVIISLPDAEPRWYLSAGRSKLSRSSVSLAMPFHSPKKHHFDGEHHWELNKAGYEFDKVVADLATFRPLRRNFRIPENPYHHFLVF